MPGSSPRRKVIVVGAGLSGKITKSKVTILNGLCAANLLHNNGFDVTVLEAGDRVGGRTYTLTPSDVDCDVNFGWADLGASYVGTSQIHVLKLAKELGCELFSSYDDQDRVMYTKGKQYRYRTAWPTFWDNPLASWDIKRVVRKLDSMSKDVSPVMPWTALKANEWDSVTVREFLRENCWTRTGLEFLESLCHINNTAEPYEMSLLFYLWYIQQGLGIDSLWAIEGGAQEYRIKGGTQQLSIKLAKKLQGRVFLEDAVTRITYNESGVLVQTLSGLIYKGSYVIVAVPPPIQLKIHFHPPLTPLRNGLLQRIAMGLVMKCLVFYQHAFWIKGGYNGLVSCGDGIEVVTHVTEDMKPGISTHGLICFVYSEQAIKLSKQNLASRKESVCVSLSRFFKSKEALRPVFYIDKVWSGEQYIGGCYTSYYTPGTLSRYGPTLRDPLAHKVFFAGTETATQWTGYMDGAVEAGYRAARQVLHAEELITSSEVWHEDNRGSDHVISPSSSLFDVSWLDQLQSNIKKLQLT